MNAVQNKSLIVSDVGTRAEAASYLTLCFWLIGNPSTKRGHSRAQRVIDKLWNMTIFFFHKRGDESVSPVMKLFFHRERNGRKKRESIVMSWSQSLPSNLLVVLEVLHLAFSMPPHPHQPLKKHSLPGVSAEEICISARHASWIVSHWGRRHFKRCIYDSEWP